MRNVQCNITKLLIFYYFYCCSLFTTDHSISPNKHLGSSSITVYWYLGNALAYAAFEAHLKPVSLQLPT